MLLFVFWLIDIFERMKKITAIPDAKADGQALKTFFKEAAPKHDDERVYSSDIKKIINWFSIIKGLPIFNDKRLKKDALWKPLLRHFR